MNIALVRHPAPLIGAGICYGRLDVALSLDGAASLGGIVDQLTGFAAQTIWSSPARRCLALADAIAADRQIPLCKDARLPELDFGDWEGQPWDSIPRKAFDRWAADPLSFAPPDGESGVALVARVRSFHEVLMARQQDCIVVSHGGPLKVLAALLRDREVDLLVPPPAFGQIDILCR